MKRGVIFFSLLMFYLSGVFLNQKIVNSQTNWVHLPEQEPVEWNPGLIKALSLGHVSTTVDSLVIRSIQDPSHRKIKLGHHAKMYYDLDLATELDPAFLDAYLFGGVYLSVVRDDLGGALNLLKKAYSYYQNELPKQTKAFQDKFWPNPWRLLISLAYVQLFDFDNLPEAVKLFRMAAKYPTAPLYLRGIKKKTENLAGIYDLGIRLILFLKRIYFRHEDRLKKIQKQYRSMIIGKSLYLVNRQFEAFCKRKPRWQKKRAWNHFSKNTILADPLGGRFYLNEDGKIKTRSKYLQTMGMPY